jgi:membrane-bound serine protease (ClpP class)
MSGKMAEVKSWQGGKGRVLVEGELWNAASDDPLKPGDRAVVHEVEGLALRIASSKDGVGFHG